MNRLTTEERTRVLSALVEGNSIRATVRMTGIAKNTIVKLLADVGAACAEYQDKTFRNLKCRRIEADEIWSFIGSKQKNTLPERREQGAGDCWTWVAIDADTKLVPCWQASPTREMDAAIEFMSNLATRLSNRIQLTTDGLRVYADAVDLAFAQEIDYAQLIKYYGKQPENVTTGNRYSPPICTGTKRVAVSGNPDPKNISTSYIERSNLTMRMQIRRFTRLTNAFSKKIENHLHAVALHFMHYNFCRIHQTLRVTPAMAAGVADHAWDVEEIVALVEQREEAARISNTARR